MAWLHRHTRLWILALLTEASSFLMLSLSSAQPLASSRAFILSRWSLFSPSRLELSFSYLLRAARISRASSVTTPSTEAVCTCGQMGLE